MKKPISLLLCAWLLAVAGAQGQSNKPRSTAWSFYTVKDEEFCVALPVHPSMHTVKEKMEAARNIKFIPATKDGKPVSMSMQLEYNFNLYQD